MNTIIKGLAWIGGGFTVILALKALYDLVFYLTGFSL
jgi:hypothetical protein